MGQTGNLREYLSDIGKNIGERNSSRSTDLKDILLPENIVNVTVYTDFNKFTIPIEEENPSLHLTTGDGLPLYVTINFKDG